MASRAASYCRGVKISVTLSVMPAAASSSRASMPAGVAGTFIMRLHVPLGPLLAQLDVARHALGVRRAGLRILQQRVELEAHVAVVAAGLLPDRAKHGLGLADQLVGHLPGDLLVGELLLDQVARSSRRTGRS